MKTASGSGGILSRYAATGSILAAALLALPGCSGVKPGRAPKDTFEAARRAIVGEEDYEGLWNLLAKRAREAEAASIRAEQQQWEGGLAQLTAEEKEKFRKENGISLDEFVNLTPAAAFAMGLRHTGRLMADLREVLADAKVVEVRPEEKRAVLVIEVAGDERPVEVALVLDYGVYRIPAWGEFIAAFRLAVPLQ